MFALYKLKSTKLFGVLVVDENKPVFYEVSCLPSKESLVFKTKKKLPASEFSVKNLTFPLQFI